MSQRDPGGPVQLVIAQAEANLRQLLNIPDNYKVLFFQVRYSPCIVAKRVLLTSASLSLKFGLQGGAHAQFAALPLNLFGESWIAHMHHTCSNPHLHGISLLVKHYLDNPLTLQDKGPRQCTLAKVCGTQKQLLRPGSTVKCKHQLQLLLQLMEDIHLYKSGKPTTKLLWP